MAGYILQNLHMIIPCIFLIFSMKFLQVHSHGRLIEPPSRASMWRTKEFENSPTNYDDNALYCGGKDYQWKTNGGKCGICGDAWDLPQPRPHEAGGTYGRGVIVRKYKTGSAFAIKVDLTANHKGFFEFRLCPNNAPKKEATQECLDKYLLKRFKQGMKNENFNETRFYPNEGNKVYEMKYMLPPSLTCSQCVLQWRYIAGNNPGTIEQEEFRGCADIAIHDSQKTKEEKETSTPNIHENEIPHETVVKPTQDHVVKIIKNRSKTISV